jgi:hypothetical protein
VNTFIDENADLEPPAWKPAWWFSWAFTLVAVPLTMLWLIGSIGRVIFEGIENITDGLRMRWLRYLRVCAGMTMDGKTPPQIAAQEQRRYHTLLGLGRIPTHQLCGRPMTITDQGRYHCESCCVTVVDKGDKVHVLWEPNPSHVTTWRPIS